ncbi:hypothetical protein DPMN_063412 [Dreissena polymorpha]|uniref:Uncharacterized protein n=1 Tax=Dreissena polymorpha TaxID=45954 RepID=A0A9D4HK77_DREPO|nr:hypothetical protein DPMN_063412 [Dreissena polymorpha]
MQPAGMTLFSVKTQRVASSYSESHKQFIARSIISNCTLQASTSPRSTSQRQE